MTKIKIIFAACLMLAFALSAVMPVFAETLEESNFGLNVIGPKTGLGGGAGKDLRVVIGNIIKTALTFLGVVALVIILIGGFKYMTAGGDTEKVKNAQNYIMYGIIGLVIILAGYAISSFVLTETQKAIKAE
jgi:hypothetical protein